MSDDRFCCTSFPVISVVNFIKLKNLLRCLVYIFLSFHSCIHKFVLSVLCFEASSLCLCCVMPIAKNILHQKLFTQNLFLFLLKSLCLRIRINLMCIENIAKVKTENIQPVTPSRTENQNSNSLLYL